ncbi:hypothetical protein EVAR_38434_1 [Eumeta japonica]|uniref:Uncharacterized protein n=1 Tax=Eumeta variegata TaxID=151549 RepID=A0A4C1X0J4_EUMVA|nr:hypothetical protein EVAR_38434_1 [Eumeta japonica]
MDEHTVASKCGISTIKIELRTLRLQHSDKKTSSEYYNRWRIIGGIDNLWHNLGGGRECVPLPRVAATLMSFGVEH